MSSFVLSTIFTSESFNSLIDFFAFFKCGHDHMTVELPLLTHLIYQLINQSIFF